MAYSDLIKEQAFSLFCIGYSFAKIAKKLKIENKKECKNINSKTVKTWAKRFDWENEREKGKKSAIENRKQSIVNLITQVAKQTEKQIIKCLEEIDKKEFSSKEGGIYATIALLNKHLELAGKNVIININNKEDVALLLTAMQSIPELNNAIEKHKSVIGKKLKELQAENEEA